MMTMSTRQVPKSLKENGEKAGSLEKSTKETSNDDSEQREMVVVS